MREIQDSVAGDAGLLLGESIMRGQKTRGHLRMVRRPLGFVFVYDTAYLLVILILIYTDIYLLVLVSVLAD